MSITPNGLSLPERVRRLRLTVQEIAAGAGLHKLTVGRALGGRADPRAETNAKILQFVEREEIALRDHLVAMHGAPELKREVA